MNTGLTIEMSSSMKDLITSDELSGTKDFMGCMKRLIQEPDTYIQSDPVKLSVLFLIVLYLFHLGFFQSLIICLFPIYFMVRLV